MLGCIAALALVVAGLAVYALSKVARERRDGLFRAAVLERQMEMVGSAAELGAVAAMAEEAHQQPEPKKPGRKERAAQAKQDDALRSAMMDPDDPEDVKLYETMVSAGLDPSNPEDVLYWNMATEGGAN